MLGDVWLPLVNHKVGNCNCNCNHLCTCSNYNYGKEVCKVIYNSYLQTIILFLLNKVLLITIENSKLKFENFCNPNHHNVTCNSHSRHSNTSCINFLSLQLIQIATCYATCKHANSLLVKYDQEIDL